MSEFKLLENTRWATGTMSSNFRRNGCLLLELLCERSLKTLICFCKYFRSLKKYRKKFFPKTQLPVQSVLNHKELPAYFPHIPIKRFYVKLITNKTKNNGVQSPPPNESLQVIFHVKCWDPYASAFQIHTWALCSCIFNCVFLYKTCFLSHRLNN